ncbi:MAG TPA: BON domain-containing protein [Candidatus Sulfotelmatobacter sp.]|nr:BON domain-containing protein [Candidatus Sulfotelmatobacter sp.]
MLRLKFVALPLFLALVFLAACNKLDDNTITTDIKAKMFSEPLLKSAAVNVTVKNGIVTITGTVPDDSARRAGERIASETKGVRQVIDSTTVTAPPQAAENVPVPPPQPEPTPAPAAPARKKEKLARPAPSPAPDNSADSSATATPAAPSAPATPAADTTPAPPPAPPAPPPPQPVTVTIPDGSIMTVRTIDSIDSDAASAGQSFRASLDAPVVVDDQVILPKGLNVKLKLVQASSAGKFKGTSELTVSLDSATYQGKTYTLSSTDVQEKGGSRGKRSAAVIGGGAALGALIGGLAGGGKGAAIGAGVGAGGGTAVQAMTKGQQVKIPSETRLDFTLHAPVAVTYLPNKNSSHVPPASSSDQPSTPNQSQ